MKRIICSIIYLLIVSSALAQLKVFRQWYPVGDDADVQYKTSYSPYETILFEANPPVRFSFYNNMLQRIGNRIQEEGKKTNSHATAVYIAFKPQFRMYTDTSLPVKTPTYKAQLGIQKLFRLKDCSFLTVALETGHFSNGQSGSSFSDKFDDETPQGDSMYTLINRNTNLSSMLNRKSGNFSTNITELNFNFRHYIPFTDSNNRDRNHYTQYPRFGHSATLGIVLYHDKLAGIGNLGGYTEQDIAIYGRWRFQFGYEFTWVLRDPGSEKITTKNHAAPRITFSEKLEVISGAHPWVNPLRSETRISYAPGLFFGQEPQLFIGFVTGHDNYNYRFLDSGNQFSIGISWTVSAPPNIGISRAK